MRKLYKRLMSCALKKLLQRHSRGSVIICEGYCKVEDSKFPGPHVNVKVSSIDSTGKQMYSKVYKARVDSGADLTVVPRSAVSAIPLDRKSGLTIRGPSGRVETIPSFCVVVHMLDRCGNIIHTGTPRSGVMLTEGDHGLLGIDILNPLTVILKDGTVTILK